MQYLTFGGLNLFPFKISQMFIELATEIALDKEWSSRKDLYWELGFFDYQR
tara:strand:- start:946 stop:1098 length:153 start_codon:yes stop_codon:yes gene_type:complete